MTNLMSICLTQPIHSLSFIIPLVLQCIFMFLTCCKFPKLRIYSTVSFAYLMFTILHWLLYILLFLTNGVAYRYKGLITEEKYHPHWRYTKSLTRTYRNLGMRKYDKNQVYENNKRWNIPYSNPKIEKSLWLITKSPKGLFSVFRKLIQPD